LGEIQLPPVGARRAGPLRPARCGVPSADCLLLSTYCSLTWAPAWA